MCIRDSIIFGDLNDKNSAVKASSENERAYYMLEEIGVQPNISYLAKVWNREETAEPVAVHATHEEAHH